MGQGQTIAVNGTVADTSARAGLVDAVAGQDLREGEIGFPELDQPPRPPRRLTRGSARESPTTYERTRKAP